MTHDRSKEAICSYLEWDSQFFGKRIARLNRERLAEADVSLTQAWCAEREIDCLYFLADSTDAHTSHLAKQNGFVSVDLRVTFERAVGDQHRLSPEPADCRTRPASQRDTEVLRRLARRLHHDSRFYFDEHFERSKCDLLYETWMDKSLNSSDQAVFVAEVGGQAAGYVSCQTEGEESRIGLLGVAEANAGTGLGTALVKQFLAWSTAQGARRATVVTQGRNVAAQRLYQRCGFLTSSVQHWYHRWFLKEP